MSSRHQAHEDRGADEAVRAQKENFHRQASTLLPHPLYRPKPPRHRKRRMSQSRRFGISLVATPSGCGSSNRRFPLRLLPTLRMNVCRRVETRYNIVRWQRSTQQPRLPAPSFCSTPNACCARPTLVSFWSGIMPRFSDWHLCRATSGRLSIASTGWTRTNRQACWLWRAIERRDSDAVISIYERLGFPWSLVWIFRSVPPSLRDPIYRLVARNRYRLFGRRDSCWIAPEQYRDRIL